MSPRKPTIDGIDDVDDEDSALEKEVAAETDLSLHEAEPEDVALGGAESTAELNSRLHDLEEEDLEDEGLADED